MTDLLVPTDRGLYCPAGDFYIDPWRPVPRAVVTHAHGDHLTRGSDAILVSDAGKHVTVARLGSDRGVTTAAWGERRAIRGVTVSLHPAGHVLGAAQVRVEHAGEVWVVSGDYKLAPDPTTAPFEPVRCHTFITESTFGLPIYRWDAPDTIAAAVRAWVTGNRTDGAATILYGYGLGKAQRLMAMLAPLEIPIWTHGAVAALTETSARHLVILGDLWHDRSSRSAAFDAALATWRERHAGVAMTLVRGNHDRRAGDPAESLAIACVDEPWSLEGVALHHHPPANDGPWLAGHVHPAARLTGLGRQALVVPCFHQRGAGMVLPAFGAFTGRGVIEPRRGDLLHCIAGDAVITRAVGR